MDGFSIIIVVIVALFSLSMLCIIFWLRGIKRNVALTSSGVVSSKDRDLSRNSAEVADTAFTDPDGEFGLADADGVFETSLLEEDADHREYKVREEVRYNEFSDNVVSLGEYIEARKKK